jgi:hypothetical protein
MIDALLRKIEELNFGINVELVSTWSRAYSRARPNEHTLAIDITKASYHLKSNETVYRQLRSFDNGLVLVCSCYSDAMLTELADALAMETGPNQKLRFEIAIATAAECAARSGLICADPDDRPRGAVEPSRLSDFRKLINRDGRVRSLILNTGRSLVLAAHAAMTGRLLVPINHRARQLAKAIGNSMQRSPAVFGKEHPPPVFLAEIGLSLLNSLTSEKANVAANGCSIQLDSLRALSSNLAAIAYRQRLTETRNVRWKKRYYQLTLKWANSAQRFECEEGKRAALILETLSVARLPKSFCLEGALASVDATLESLPILSLMEVANAAITAEHFLDARTILERIEHRIPEDHRPATARFARLRLAAELGLRRECRSLTVIARDVCSDFPHDMRMLEHIIAHRGRIRELLCPG